MPARVCRARVEESAFLLVSYIWFTLPPTASQASDMTKPRIPGDFVTNPVAASFLGGHSGCAAADERVQDDIIGIGVKLDAACGQIHRIGGRVLHLLGRLRGELPYAFRPRQKILFADGCPLLIALRFLARKVPLAEDQDILVYISQNRVDGERQLPHAQDEPALACLFQMIWPRIRKPTSIMS